MPYGSVLTDTVQSSTTGTPPQFNDGSGTQIGTLCRAWVQYNAATSTITSSFNVSSVTKVATGKYTFTFTNAFADTKYAWSGGVGFDNGNQSNFLASPTAVASSTWLSTSSIQLWTYYSNGNVSTFDPNFVNVLFFR